MLKNRPWKMLKKDLRTGLHKKSIILFRGKIMFEPRGVVDLAFETDEKIENVV
jgi:hypothetical protein